MAFTTIQVIPKPGVADVRGANLASQARRFLGIDTGRIQAIQVYLVDYDLPEQRIAAFAQEVLCDPITQLVTMDEPWVDPGFASYLLVAKHAGVTDDVGITAQRALADFLGQSLDVSTQHIYSQDLYLVEQRLPAAELRRIGEELAGNPLIHYMEAGPFRGSPHFLPRVELGGEPEVRTIGLDLPDEELLRLSREMVLSLNLEELGAIRDHYRDPAVLARRREVGLPDQPTDCELEVFAQTWSEHCKHKEFDALISYTDADTGEARVIDSLFKTTIRGSTLAIKERLEAHGHDWLIKVFDDNAGVVRVDEERVFVWKVETHNTPSALDPYGGAITGILGNNRDPLGTGRGGGRLLFNTNVLCFGAPDHDKPLLSGQLHPSRIFAGVREGIEDGGNKSGVPTVNGAIVFDDRYAGKPLVYCGTGSIMPARYGQKNSWEKEIHPGDLIYMAGGRVGKDGIHGATFSSVEIDKHSPRTAVQIGSPITQKLVSDMLEVATARGIVQCTTDNGAGGLASSIGELAPMGGGAVVWLDRVPLKYPGLQPWEIFVSESQERMQLVVAPDHREAMEALAAEYEVELSLLGEFTDEGTLDIRYGEQRVALFDLEFLHEGVPRKHMVAEWKAPEAREPTLTTNLNHNEIIERMLAHWNVCSREQVIRQYDHEVKGKTLIKPLMGPRGRAPQDAAVMRIGFDGYTGVAVSNGILPRYTDLDAYHASAAAFDEAVRSIIAVGGRLPHPEDPDCPFWSVNDNFCVPDSAWDPVGNPDGKYKLAQLVRLAEALYDSATTYGVPMTSGKDSMKNDFRADGQKISVPPTLLYSMAARIDDVRLTRTAEFKAPGDVVLLLGQTRDELGCSIFYDLFGVLGAHVPKVDRAAAMDLYDRVASSGQVLVSCHDLSDGGLAVALAEAAFGGDLGCEVEVGSFNLSLNASLYSESPSRFVATVRSEDLDAAKAHFGAHLRVLGTVTEARRVVIRHQGEVVVDRSTESLFAAWSRDLGV